MEDIVKYTSYSPRITLKPFPVPRRKHLSGSLGSLKQYGKSGNITNEISLSLVNDSLTHITCYSKLTGDVIRMEKSFMFISQLTLN